MHAFVRFEYRKCEKGLLRPDGQIGFSTEIGRAEIYSMIFHYASWFGLDSLHCYVELVEGLLGPVGACWGPRWGPCSALFYFAQRQILELAKKFDGYRKVLVPIKEV